MKNTSIRLGEIELDILNKRATATRPRSQVLRDILRRYATLTERSMPPMDDRERAVVSEVLGDFEGHHGAIGSLGAIFDLCAPAGWMDLRLKFDTLDYAGCLALADWIELRQAEVEKEANGENVS